MKRIICLVLTAIMIFSTFTVFGQEGDKATDSLLIDSRISALIDLGIIDAYVPEADVTRYTVRESLKRIMGDDAITVKFFGENYVDRAITLDNALTILLDTLGYTNYVSVKEGSYNANTRYNIARKIGLVDSNVRYNSKLNMSVYAILLWNTLFEVNMYEVSGIAQESGKDGVISYETGRLMGDVFLNIKRVYGVVNGVCNTNIKNGINSEDVIIIGESKFKFINLYPDKYIGRYVEAFIDKDTNEAKAVRIIEKKNMEWVIASEDIDKHSTLTKLSYYDEKDKKRSIPLENVDVVYNGICFETVTDATLIQEDAVYTVIDNDGDKNAEVIFIDVYDVKRVHIFSKGTDETYLTCADGTYYDFKEFYEDGRYIEKADGTPLDWAEISKNDVLLIRRSLLPGESSVGEAIVDINKVIWSMEKVNGIVKYIHKDNKAMTVDGTKYPLAEALIKDTEKMDKLKAGDEVTCYMDAFGRVADVDVYSSSEKVAAVIGIKADGKGILNNIILKCITEDNKVEMFTFKSSVVLDGKKIEAEKLISSNTYKAKFYTGDKVIEQLIKIKVNSKNEITAITTADGFADDDFSKYATLDNSYYDAWGVKTLNGRYIADSKTKVFTVWPEEDRFSNATETGAMSDNTYTLYCVDEDTNHVGYILNPYRTYGIKANAEIWGEGNTYMVLDKGAKIDTRTEGEVNYLLCWNGDRTVELIGQSDDLIPTTHKGNSLALLAAEGGGNSYLYTYLKEQVGNRGWKKRRFIDLEPGTIISIATTDGYVSAFDICFAPDFVEEDLRNGTWNSLPFEGQPTYKNNNVYGVSKTRFYQDLIYSYGEVQRLTPYGPVVNNHLPTNEEIKEYLPAGTELNAQMAKDIMNGQGSIEVFPIRAWERIYSIDSTVNIWFFDLEKNQLTKGDFSNIRPGDRIFARHQKTNTLMFVYRLSEE